MTAMLLSIDFINDLVHPEGKRNFLADYVSENNVIQYANKAIEVARQKNMPIAHVKVGFSANYVECPANSPLFSSAKDDGALILGSWGTEFYDELDVQPADTVIVKHRVSALYATPLQTLLTANQVDTVILCGVSTNMAIETVTRELHDRDYHVIIVKDACGSMVKEAHEASLMTLQRIAKVINAAELSNTI